jgi:hypothetical protein
MLGGVDGCQWDADNRGIVAFVGEYTLYCAFCCEGTDMDWENKRVKAKWNGGAEAVYFYQERCYGTSMCSSTARRSRQRVKNAAEWRWNPIEWRRGYVSNRRVTRVKN